MWVFLHLYINLHSNCSLQIRNFYTFFSLMSHNLPPLVLLFRNYPYNWFIRVSLPIHLPTYPFTKFTSFVLTVFDGISFISLFVLFLRFFTISFVHLSLFLPILCFILPHTLTTFFPSSYDFFTSTYFRYITSSNLPAIIFLLSHLLFLLSCHLFTAACFFLHIFHSFLRDVLLFSLTQFSCSHRFPSLFPASLSVTLWYELMSEFASLYRAVTIAVQ
jgi:hypothetical protein